MIAGSARCAFRTRSAQGNAFRDHGPVVCIRSDHRPGALQRPGVEPTGGLVVRANRRHRQNHVVAARSERPYCPRGAPLALRCRAWTHQRSHRHGVVDAVRGGSSQHLRPSSSPRFAKNTACPSPSSRRPQRADFGSTTCQLDIQDVVAEGPSSIVECGIRFSCSARSVRTWPRTSSRMAGSFWPTRSTSSASTSWRCDADRRVPHARLLAILGRRDLRGAVGRRLRAGEPRQRSRPPGPCRRRLHRRRRRPELPAEVWEQTSAATSRPTSASPGSAFERASYPANNESSTQSAHWRFLREHHTCTVNITPMAIHGPADPRHIETPVRDQRQATRRVRRSRSVDTTRGGRRATGLLWAVCVAASGAGGRRYCRE